MGQTRWELLQCHRLLIAARRLLFRFVLTDFKKDPRDITPDMSDHYNHENKNKERDGKNEKMFKTK